jgi:hypothetical protein
MTPLYMADTVSWEKYNFDVGEKCGGICYMSRGFNDF